MNNDNAVCCWDFTLWDTDIDIKPELERIAKKWCFQKERGSGGGEHFQGRFSLKIKKRLDEFTFFNAHRSKTSKANRDNDFYVCKEETRIAGPWKNTDPYVPRQIRDVVLYAWQKKIAYDDAWDTRHINIVIDKVGNIGKSVLVGYCCTVLRNAATIPPLNNYKDIMAMVLCVPISKKYLIDMPRASEKFNQTEFFAAIESIKDGHAFDTRYSYKEKWFDCPNIWVFTNVVPDKRLLSKDRWRLWEVRNGDLEALRCNTNSKSPAQLAQE